MENKQTAIDWLEEELAKNLKHIVEKQDYILMESLFTKAKEMEKEQIIKSIIDTIVGSNDIYDKEYPEIRRCAEQYYNETYGKE